MPPGGYEDFIEKRDKLIAKYASDIDGLKMGFTELFKDEQYKKLDSLRQTQARLDKINAPTEENLAAMKTIRELIKRSELELSKLASAKPWGFIPSEFPHPLASAKGGRRRRRKTHKRRKSHKRKSRKN